MERVCRVHQTYLLLILRLLHTSSGEKSALFFATIFIIWRIIHDEHDDELMMFIFLLHIFFPCTLEGPAWWSALSSHSMNILGLNPAAR